MAFPDSATLKDDFNRANSDLSSGDWSQLGNGTNGPMTIVSNAVTKGGAGNYTGSYWDTATFGPDIHAWVALPNHNVNNGYAAYFALWVRVPNPTAGTVTGYKFAVVSDAGGSARLTRADSGSETTLDEVTGIGASWTPGSTATFRVGIGIEGTVIRGYRWNGSAWSEEMSHDYSGDGTKYESAGNVAMDCFQTVTTYGYDDLTFGTVEAAGGPSQRFMWMP